MKKEKALKAILCLVEDIVKYWGDDAEVLRTTLLAIERAIRKELGTK